MKYGLSVKTWKVPLDGREYTFRYEHQFWTGEKRCYIDDELLAHIPGGLGPSASIKQEFPFRIDEHAGEFRHRAAGRMTFYSLVIDGQEIEGTEEHGMRMPPWVLGVLIGLLLLLAFVSMNV